MRILALAAPAALVLLLVGVAAFTQTPPYDLLLKGGHVIDPRNGVDGVRDVAVRAGHVAAVVAGIEASTAKQTIDVRGLYVTPGLVDIHAHVYAGTHGTSVAGGLDSVTPDHIGFRAGVTTMVDVGSSGWRNFPEFRRTVIDRSKTRVLAMLNIAGMGMPNYEVEQNPADLDPKETAAMAKKHADVVVGIKSAHWRQPTFLSVDKAVEAGKLASIPVMVDFGYFLPERPYQVMVLDKLRPGDMSTHFYRWPAPLLDGNDKVMEYLYVARKRGVKFDVGHGGGSFHFRQAEPMVKQGFWPDSISTDVHSGSINGAMIDMLNVMSKFLVMGVPLVEVIRQSTTNPAAQVQRPQLGQIAVGAEADIAVLRLDRGRFGYVDVKGGKIEGDQRLACELTVRGGQIVFDVNGRAGVAWRDAKIEYPTK
jgi:dihydroorotase